jgi:SAM-dependent methyltransferase
MARYALVIDTAGNKEFNLHPTRCSFGQGKSKSERKFSSPTIKMILSNHVRDLVEEGVSVLNYQPFVLTDDIQTGVGYSWIAPGDVRVDPPLVFRRSDYGLEWPKICDANARLRAMYDDLLDEVAQRFSGASLLDVACNNGYFPVGAELRGMRGTGMDLGDYSASIGFLNKCLGTHARFLHEWYDSTSHTFPSMEKHDVVVMSAIMCHIPDPLNFLAAAAKRADKAFLFWGQIVETDALVVSYQPPHRNLSSLTDFPVCFNDNTRLSRGLFELSLRQLGFGDIIEIAPRETWFPQLHTKTALPLERELKEGSRHVALLAIR